jgi:hypothetical protein
LLDLVRAGKRTAIMAEPAQDLLMIGLADAGKTSFIHAIDELLHSPSTEDALRAAGLAYDRTYLERDKPVFREGRKLERTTRTEAAPVELWFEDPKSGKQGRLFLPDVSGEVYRDQWVNRIWDKSYAASLERILGVLLFVRADMPASNAELLGALIDKAGKGGPTQSWDPKKASAQVQLVDVMQFIALRGAIRVPLRVAVMISAWDVVAKMGARAPSPEQFFQKDWALLSQYLTTNQETFEARVYGVSALGGTFDELKELRKVPPAERVRIVDGPSDSRDLTRPLRWLLRPD